jgi:hypothetical protein
LLTKPKNLSAGKIDYIEFEKGNPDMMRKLEEIRQNEEKNNDEGL